MSSSASTSIKIPNRLGLHARPAMVFVETAMRYDSDVRVRRADQTEEVDGKSIMQLMMLAATQGTELIISAAGADAHDAIDGLRQLVESCFGEE